MSEDSRWGDPHAAWAQTSSLLALRELIRAGEQVAPAVANRAGLSHNELRTLEHLVDHPMGPSELSRVLGVTSAASSGIIDRLEQRGHATRVDHASDKRRTSVTISDSGRAEVVGHLMPMFRELAALDAAFSEDEREVVARYLQGALRAVRTVT